jgi:hypothetical protein
MRDDAIVAYKHAPIDAELELEGLGDVFAESVLLFCQDIVRGRSSGGIDHWGLLPFDDYRGVPVYKYAYDARFALVAVEDLGEGDRRVSLVMAGRTGSAVAIDGAPWDGIDMSALRDRFLKLRLKDYFV